MPARHRGTGRADRLGGYTPSHGHGARSQRKRSDSMQRGLEARWRAFLQSWER